MNRGFTTRDSARPDDGLGRGGHSECDLGPFSAMPSHSECVLPFLSTVDSHSGCGLRPAARRKRTRRATRGRSTGTSVHSECDAGRESRCQGHSECDSGLARGQKSHSERVVWRSRRGLALGVRLAGRPQASNAGRLLLSMPSSLGPRAPCPAQHDVARKTASVAHSRRAPFLPSLSHARTADGSSRMPRLQR